MMPSNPTGPERSTREENSHGRPLRGMWLSDLSIKQPVFIAMLVLATLVLGWVSYTRLGLELYPDVSLPIVVVQTVYPGADPGEVERSVTKPLEDAVSSLNGVQTLRSTSMDSLSMVVVEFDMNRDPRLAEDDVRTRVSLVRNTLPRDVQEPLILKYDLSAAPVVSFAAADSTGRRSPEVLRTLADDVLKARIERVPGVANAEIVGGLVREVHVDLRMADLEAYGIPIQQVVQAIRAENLDVPAGRMVDGQREELWRTAGELRSLPELGEIPLATRPLGVVVRIKHLADVTEGHAEVRTLSRLDGQDSVVVQVRKQSGTNTVRVADAIKKELASIEAEYPELRFAIAFDQSTFTRDSVQDVQISLLLGGVLAALVVLLFFRDLRNTLVTVAGLPVIVFGTFAVMYALGLSLNMITLLALSLTVGLLIDDAIVVRENIFRHTERGEEPRVAASRATAEIALAVVAVTSTTVAVFLPMALTGGVAGRFLSHFGIPVAAAVLISLVEAFTLAPMLSAYFFKRVDPRAARRRPGPIGRAFDGLNDGYRGVLAWSLTHRLIVVVIGVIALGASLAVLPLMRISDTAAAAGAFGVSVDLGSGARLADTDRVARAAEQVLQATPGVQHVYTTVGATDGSVETATIMVQLQSTRDTFETMERVRGELAAALGGTKFNLIDPESATGAAMMGSAFSAMIGQAIQFSVRGDDFAALDRVSAELVDRLRQLPDAVDVERSIKPARQGRAIVLDRARAADFGVTSAQVGSTVRTAVTGERVGSYRAEGKALDIVVRLNDSARSSPADVLRLPIATARGALVPLAQLTTIEETTEPTRIERLDRQRNVVVGSGYRGTELGAVTEQARAVVAAMELPEGVTIQTAGAVKYQDEMLAQLGLALGLSILFVYMTLASQFGSFVHPFTIMLALPFSLIGALLSLFVAGFNVDGLAMIGIILLMGLVTKNSILLVDFTNRLRRRGLSVREAILEAGPVRLRPILMTTLAMVFGMLPVAAGFGAGAEIRQPMGVSVVGGLITSTVLTLLVVPVVYSLIDDLAGLVTRRRARAPLAPAAEGAPGEDAAG